MMSCSEITEQVTAYLDRRMPLSQRMAFRMHIMMCRHCRRYLRQMRATVALTGKMPVEPVPDEVRDDLVRALLAVRQDTADNGVDPRPETGPGP